ncbi:MAG TPA: carboxypeptidase regulatory-like domain-containing protein [Steroidobacteraceae bacterium]|nr:carboxypeptidase regulatory-like domain-containing protein [Steroidobacteraceae bacterium]
MSVLRKVRVALACVAGLLSLHCYGSTDWLLGQQQSDGSFTRPQDLALPIQSTAETVTTLRLLGVTSVGLAPSYIASDTYEGTEYLARKILVQADNSAATAPLIARLLTHQNPDGGFGELQGYQSSSLDTAFALEALIGAGRSDTRVGSGAMFLLQSQSSDGSWSNASQSDVYTTALCVRALNPLKDRLGSAAATIAAANNFILSRRAADGLWGEDFLSAQALLSLATTSVDVAPIQQSADAFKARRLTDTSWSDDVYATALALRAFFVYDARRAGGTLSASGGAVSGYVFRAGTSEAIPDVVIAAGTGAQAKSNSEGYFVLSALPAGNQTLTLQKSGYVTPRCRVSVFRFCSRRAE